MIVVSLLRHLEQNEHMKLACLTSGTVFVSILWWGIPLASRLVQSYFRDSGKPQNTPTLNKCAVSLGTQSLFQFHHYWTTTIHLQIDEVQKSSEDVLTFPSLDLHFYNENSKIPTTKSPIERAASTVKLLNLRYLVPDPEVAFSRLLVGFRWFLKRRTRSLLP